MIISSSLVNQGVYNEKGLKDIMEARKQVGLCGPEFLPGWGLVSRLPGCPGNKPNFDSSN